MEYMVEEKEVIQKMQPNNYLDKKNKGIRVLLLLCKNGQSIADCPIYDCDIFGKKVKDWVLASVEGSEVRELGYSVTDDLLSLIRPYLGNEEITVVLYGDTPLLTKATMNYYLEDFTVKMQNVRKLPRGYIFNTEFVNTAENIYAPDLGNGHSEEFMAVYNGAQLSMVTNIIKNRIVNYHVQNGVILKDASRVYIDAEAEIAEGVVVYPNNTIMGKSVIEKGCYLYPNNVIVSSYVGEHCLLKGAYIENAKVKEHSVLEPFSKIILKNS